MLKLLLSFIGLCALCNAADILNIASSEEIDSSEFGGPPGLKGTSCPCGWTNKGNIQRIGGGKPTGRHEYPFMAKLKVEGASCGGVIISRRHMITATHCVYGRSTSEMTVSVGEHNPVDGDEHIQVLKVTEIHSHADYNPIRLSNDITILTLSTAIKFNDYVGPVCIPTSELPIENKYVKVLGWGNKTVPELHEMNLRVIDDVVCRKVWSGLIDSKQYCTYGKDKSIGSEDTGGSILWLDTETNRYNLAGIVSFGQVVGVSTKVSAYYEWIDRIVRIKTSWLQSASSVPKVCIKN